MSIIQLPQIAKRCTQPSKSSQLYCMQYKKTGWFKVGIREWKGKDPADQIWETFKKDFAKEYDEIKEEQEVTAQAAGYTQANN
eukprot:9148990-Ditylum_brightwellii.AAC.1